MTADQELEAVLHFGGGGLYIKEEALRRSMQLRCDDRRVTITLPGSPDLDQTPAAADVRSAKSAWRSNLDPRTGAFLGALVDRFEVRVQVTGDADAPLGGAVEEAFPYAVEVAEHFLSWMRTLGGQYWLPARHEGPHLAGFGVLVYAGTDEEVDPAARWELSYVLDSSADDDGATVEQIDEAMTRSVAPPPIEDVLLADAEEAASVPPIASPLQRGRRDTGRVVLLAAIAAEVKIKQTLVEKCPTQLGALLDVVLENPRDVSVATGQLLDKPMKAVLGVSLREADRDLYKAVAHETAQSHGLFPLRNRVAHHGFQPTVAEAEAAVDTARRLFAWLDSL